MSGTFICGWTLVGKVGEGVNRDTCTLPWSRPEAFHRRQDALPSPYFYLHGPFLDQRTIIQRGRAIFQQQRQKLRGGDRSGRAPIGLVTFISDATLE